MVVCLVFLLFSCFISKHVRLLLVVVYHSQLTLNCVVIYNKFSIMTYFIIFILIFFTTTPALAVQNNEWIVKTEQDSFIGHKASDGDYISFYGIRYGRDTSGYDRFMPPNPERPYYTLYNATDKVHCIQPSPGGLIKGSEHCLSVDIFTKNITGSKPVIVWLEGEEYLSSKINTTFRRLVIEDIVVVSLNYRVSVFGFLCLGVSGAPGNVGLMDCVLGLHWIKKNIAQFGGDPNNVMLLGHGSGAAMVDLITMSPLSKDLVHKAFVISGSALAPWAISYDPIGYANIVGERLAYSGKPPTNLANKLKSTELNVLLSALDFDATNNTLLFAPCVENDKLQNIFLNDTPIAILKNGNFNHIPYVAVFADKEGTIRASKYSDWKDKMKTNLTQFISGDLEFESELNKTKAVNSISEFYFGNITSIDVEDYLEYHGDTSIIVPLIRGVKARANTSRANVYLLEFAYRGSTNDDWPYPDIPVNGVKHGEILEYLFDKNMTKHGENAKTSLINHIVSFVRTGKPSLNAEPGQEWLPVHNQRFNYLYFGGAYNEPHREVLQLDPHTQTMTFWNNIYDDYQKIPKGGSAAPKLEVMFYLIGFIVPIYGYYHL